jgi:hypothetical protein
MAAAGPGNKAEASGEEFTYYKPLENRQWWPSSLGVVRRRGQICTDDVLMSKDKGRKRK